VLIEGRRVNWFAQELALPYFTLREPNGKVLIDVQAMFGYKPMRQTFCQQHLSFFQSAYSLQ
jgi:hypothetical protein